MPIFDFSCRECGEKFDLMIANKDKDKVRCPKCGASNVKQLLSMFSTTGGSKSPAPACARPGCGASGSGG
ncbi:FmdB family zinc ribbon protein [Syntrophomonas erecta]